VVGWIGRPDSVLLFRRRGRGELRRPPPEGGALASIDADYAMFAAEMVPTHELEAPVRTQAFVRMTAQWPHRASRADRRTTLSSSAAYVPEHVPLLFDQGTTTCHRTSTAYSHERSKSDAN
jgi:hypothetical protein